MQIKVTKCIKNALFFRNIWSIQKIVVLLRAFSRESVMTVCRNDVMTKKKHYY